MISKNIKPIIYISIAIYLLGEGLGWLQGKPIGTFTMELKNFGIYFMYSALIGFGNFWVAEQLDKLFPWNQIPKKRAVYGIIAAVIVSMSSIFLARIITVLSFYGKTWNYFIETESKMTYIYSLMLSMVIVLGFYSYYFFKEISSKAIKEQQVVAKTETAKFESLKSQIDPHFLFNSLNVLTSLIGENPKQAEEFTTKLSHIYRYVLEQKDKDLVPLEEELQFAKTYMDLLKMRFENAIQFEIPETISNPEFKIVPLSLQLVLENAVKHNVISEEKPLIINIKEEGGYLTISNNLNEKKTFQKGTGVGLKNISDRYNLISYKKINLKKDKENFIISLPLLTQKTNIMNTDINEENRYIRARKKVDKIKKFYHFLTTYIILIPFFIGINYFTNWDHKWFYFPIIGMGIGLLFSFMEAFGYSWFLGNNWEERKIKELMDEEDKEKWV